MHHALALAIYRYSPIWGDAHGFIVTEVYHVRYDVARREYGLYIAVVGVAEGYSVGIVHRHSRGDKSEAFNLRGGGYDLSALLGCVLCVLDG